MKDIYSLADLQKRKQIMAFSKTPVRLGVIGDPVEHSLSPTMQNAALKHGSIEIGYARFHILPNELEAALELVRELKFVGINLTVPHKIAAVEFMDAQIGRA